jgi:transposase InsO family protein
VPWETPDLMSVRQEFITLALSGRYTITECAVMFGVSEKTGHKWLSRFRREGPLGLDDRSHAPQTPPHQVDPQVRREITDLREQHPTWGPRKLRAVLERKFPDINWPASSTIGELLRRQGLVSSSRRRRKIHPLGPPLDAGLTVAAAPNDVWTTDFKGEFRLASGPYCYPLTVCDAQTRYLLGCTALFSTAGEPVEVIFKRIFQRYGLPQVIRSDNGVPFASPVSLGRLSKLSVWWILLGIRPERIDPGHPQQNGQHERMHKTLKAEATRPPSSTLTQQQQRFDYFRREYNNERPHEALGQRPPASCYTSSLRQFPKRLSGPEYPAHFEIRRVAINGSIVWKGRHFWLSKSLAAQEIGFEEIDTDTWSVNFGRLALGSYHPPSNTFLPEVYWRVDETPNQTPKEMTVNKPEEKNHDPAASGSPILPV